MPVCLVERKSDEARAYELLLKHSKSCRLCQANGRRWCRKYQALHARWEKYQVEQS